MITTMRFKRAGKPTDLHLFAETDHFMFAEDNVRVLTVVREWLARYFPATRPTVWQCENERKPAMS
jgi:hypothetical protein